MEQLRRDSSETRAAAGGGEEQEQAGAQARDEGGAEVHAEDEDGRAALLGDRDPVVQVEDLRPQCKTLRPSQGNHPIVSRLSRP
jgi:hypothetical protein